MRSGRNALRRTSIPTYRTSRRLLMRVQVQAVRKRDIDRTLAMTRTSTASMGKFDRVLDGEKKLRGIKRKVSVPACLPQPHESSLLSPQFNPIEKSVHAERSANMALIKHIGNGGGSLAKKAIRQAVGDGAEDVVNVRKAVRFVSGSSCARTQVRVGLRCRTKAEGKEVGRVFLYGVC